MTEKDRPQDPYTYEYWRGQCEKTLSALESDYRLACAFEGYVGFSGDHRWTLLKVSRFAKSTSPVFIFGDSGLGKEIVANAIHQLSERQGGFVPFNCAAIPDSTMQLSALFGHKKGSFTGATADFKGLLRLADGGTLFLDEVGWLDPRAQASLNRAIEPHSSCICRFRPVGGTDEEEANVRIIGAFNKAIFLEDFLPSQIHHPFVLRHNYYVNVLEQPAKAGDSEAKEQLAQILSDAEEKGIPNPSVEELESLLEEYIKNLNIPRPSEDFAYRLRSLSISIPSLQMRLLDAVAITIYLAEEAGLELSSSDILTVMENCIRGGVRTIKSVLQEYSLMRKYMDQLPLKIRLAVRWRAKDLRFLVEHGLGNDLEKAFDMLRENLNALQSIWKNAKRRGGGRVGSPEKYDHTPGELYDAWVQNNFSKNQAASYLKMPPTTFNSRFKKSFPDLDEEAVKKNLIKR